MRYGTIITPKIYQKICKSEHFFKQYRGFGISKTELKEIINEGIKIIQIIYMGKKETEVFIATTKQYSKSEKEYNNNGDIQKIVSVGEMIIQWKR